LITAFTMSRLAEAVLFIFLLALPFNLSKPVPLK